MVPNVAQDKVEDKESIQMNHGRASNGENVAPSNPGTTDDKEQRKRRKKKKNKNKGQDQGVIGSEDDSREITLIETMSSMGTNGDDVALDPKDPDSLSRSKARRVRRKRLKERNTNCNEGALDNVAADNKCAGTKPKMVGSESSGLSKPAAAPSNDEVAVTTTAVLVSDDGDQIVEQGRQTTPVKDVECTIDGLGTPSSASNKFQPTPVEKTPLDHTFVESTSIDSDVAPDLGNNKDCLDKQEQPIDGAANTQTVEKEPASPVVDEDSLMIINASTEDPAQPTKPLETPIAPTPPESQNLTADEGLVSLGMKASHQPLQENKLKTTEASSNVSVGTTTGESVDQTELPVVDTSSQPMHDDETLAITEESSDVQLRIPAPVEEAVDQHKPEEQVGNPARVEEPVDQPTTEDKKLVSASSGSQYQQIDLPLALPDQATQPQLLHQDDKVVPDDASGAQPSDQVPWTTSPPLNNESHQSAAPTVLVNSSTSDGAEVAASKTQTSLAYVDEDRKADKEDCGCAKCNIM